MNPDTDPPVPAPDPTPPQPGEETQELLPEDVDQPEGEGGNGGEKYDGGEIPPAPADAEPVE